MNTTSKPPASIPFLIPTIDTRVVRILEVRLTASDKPSLIQVEVLVPADAADLIRVQAFRVTY